MLYWLNHPSLSYLFSGLFVGPTSQAPRIDEARHDLLYELEIAFSKVPAPGGTGWVPPWLVDRLFRNILVDVTGNTHRTEICIDKLYSPDGPTGRLGLVEFRSFRNAAARAHEPRPAAFAARADRVVLACAARSASRCAGARRCTTVSCSPHFVWEDFLEVLDDLKRAGYVFDPAWFEAAAAIPLPAIAARFTMAVSRLNCARRSSLGMCSAKKALPAARCVLSIPRSSGCRSKSSGLNEDRHVVTCNGRRLPLRSTGRSGEFVAGVRFKAWDCRRRCIRQSAFMCR